MLNDAWFLILVAVVGFLAGSVASVSGFGIGSLLTPVLAVRVGTKLAVAAVQDPTGLFVKECCVRVGTKLAVAAVSVPYLTATALRFWIMRKHVDRRLLLSFGLMSASGGLAGALLPGQSHLNFPEILGFRRFLSRFRLEF